MRTYEEAVATLGDRDAVDLPGEVRLQRGEAETLELRFQDAPLLLYRPGGVLTVFAQDRTKKVRNRINTYAPIEVTSLDGVWKVGDRVWGNQQEIVVRGEQIDGLLPSYMESGLRTNRDAAVRYARSLVKLLRQQRLRAPGQERCTYCSLMVGDRTLGEAMENSSHLEGHIYDYAYMPVLIGRAVETAPEALAAEVTPLLQNRWTQGLDFYDDNYISPEDPRWQKLLKLVRRYLLTHLHYAIS